MTNRQKGLLRYIIRYQPEMPDEEIALEVGCVLSTVKKYRKALTPKKDQ